MFKVDKHISRGIQHANFNEDNLFESRLGKSFFVAAVMDGCSTAVESHFASALYKKSLRKALKVLQNLAHLQDSVKLEKMTPSEISDFIWAQLFSDLKKNKRQLFLRFEELLSTMVLSVINIKTGAAQVSVSGDGLFWVNGERFGVDQGNQPDFLAYHLGKPFDPSDDQRIPRWEFSKVESLIISTDGLLKFRKGNLSVEALLFAQAGDWDDVNGARGNKASQKEKYVSKKNLDQKIEALKKEGYVAHDDLAIVSAHR